MFPNLRLLIGALAASVAALCCGFGVFAAFRVSHEPLSRLPAATAPLQLVLNEVATPRPTWGTPVTGLAALNVSDVGETAMVRPATSSIAPSVLDAAKAPMTAAVKPAALVDPVPLHATLPSTQTASVNPAIQTLSAEAHHAASAAPSSNAAEPPSATAAPAAPHAAPSVSAPLPQPDKTIAVTRANTTPPVIADAVKESVAPPEKVPAKSALTPPFVAHQLARAAPDDSANATPAAVAAIDPPSAPALPDGQSSESSVLLPEARPVAIWEAKAAQTAKARKAMAKAIERRRLVLKRRLVSKPRAVVAQSGGDPAAFHDPVFRSAPDFPTHPETRTRSVNQTANSDATTNSFAWPNRE